MVIDISPKVEHKPIPNYLKNPYSFHKKCNFLMPTGKKCRMLALSKKDFCQWHLPIEEKVLYQQNKAEQKYFNLPKEKNDSGQDLQYEISLLKNLLSRLTKIIPQDSIDEPKLKLLLSIIEQIRKTIHSLKLIESQGKMYRLMERYIEAILSKVVIIINKYVLDDDTKKIIAEELLALSRQGKEIIDLNDLIKLVNIPQGNSNRF